MTPYLIIGACYILAVLLSSRMNDIPYGEEDENGSITYHDWPDEDA